MPNLTPLQYERLRSLRQCALFKYFHPLSLELLTGYAIDAKTQCFRTSVTVSGHELGALGLLPMSHYSRLMEEAVMALGYVLSGELLMPARMEADYLLAVGPDETLELVARQSKRQGRLAWFEVTLLSAGAAVCRGTVTAMEIRTLPEAMQLKMVKAAEQGRFDIAVLAEFIHLFDPRHYLSAKRAIEQAPDRTWEQAFD